MWDKPFYGLPLSEDGTYPTTQILEKTTNKLQLVALYKSSSGILTTKTLYTFTFTPTHLVRHTERKNFLEVTARSLESFKNSWDILASKTNNDYFVIVHNKEDDIKTFVNDWYGDRTSQETELFLQTQKELIDFLTQGLLASTNLNKLI